MTNYPKNSLLLYFATCSDCVKVETKIKHMLLEFESIMKTKLWKPSTNWKRIQTIIVDFNLEKSKSTTTYEFKIYSNLIFIHVHYFHNY